VSSEEEETTRKTSILKKKFLVTKPGVESFEDWSSENSVSDDSESVLSDEGPQPKPMVNMGKGTKQKFHSFEEYENSRTVRQKGIFMSVPNATSVPDQMARAAEVVPQINKNFVVPDDLKRCLEAELEDDIACQRKKTLQEYVEFSKRKSTMRRNEYLKKMTPVTNQKIMSKFNLAVLEKMLYDADMGGSQFLEYMIKGFPVTGIIDQPGVFDRDERCAPEISRRQLHRHGRKQAKELLRNSKPSIEEGIGEKNMETLNWEACEMEVQAGAMEKPILLTELIEKNEQFVPTSRFGVIQADPSKPSGYKHRPIDNCKRSWLNRATAVRTPAQLVKIDDLTAGIAYLKETSDKLNKPVQIKLAKGDHKTAYKQIAIRESQKPYLYIVCRNPVDGKMYAFKPVALVFGSTAAVINYNMCSLAVTRILRKLFKLPVLSYFDDFVIPTVENKTDSEDSVLDIFNGVNDLIGFVVHKGKEEYGTIVAFLGIVFDLSEEDFLTLKIDESRKNKLLKSCEDALKSKRLYPSEAGTLAGKLSFAQSVAWGRIGRAMLKALYYRQQCPAYLCKVSPEIENSINWFKYALLNNVFQSNFRISEWNKERIPCHIYTDAASSGVLAAIGFWQQTLGEASTCIADNKEPPTGSAIEKNPPLCVTHKFDNYELKHRNIQLLEALAVLAFLEQCGEKFRNQSVVFWIDNTAAQSPIQRGYTSRDPMRRVVHRIWKLLADLRISMWCERVHSSTNVADDPSRKDFETTDLLKCEYLLLQTNCKWFEEIIKEAKEQIDNAMQQKKRPNTKSEKSRKDAKDSEVLS
jgi:hypothetical protein